MNYTCPTLKTIMVLTLERVKRLSDLNLLRKTPRGMKITEDSVTFQAVFGTENARLNHPYGPSITLSQAEDECLFPVRLVKEYIAKTKDREGQSEKLFVIRKMGMAVAVFSCQLAKRNLDPSQH